MQSGSLVLIVRGYDPRKELNRELGLSDEPRQQRSQRKLFPHQIRVTFPEEFNLELVTCHSSISGFLFLPCYEKRTFNEYLFKELIWKVVKALMNLPRMYWPTWWVSMLKGNQPYTVPPFGHSQIGGLVPIPISYFIRPSNTLCISD